MLLEGPESRKTPVVSNLCSAMDTENKRLHAEDCYIVILDIFPFPNPVFVNSNNGDSFCEGLDR